VKLGDPAGTVAFFVALNEFRRPLLDRFPRDVVARAVEVWIRVKAKEMKR